MTTHDDAREFGLHIKQGGWRLGLLVARNVEKGNGAGERTDVQPRRDRDKVSARAFADASGTSADRVLRYLAAWEKAATAGHVPHAGDLEPGSEPELDAGNLPDWGDFYDATAGSPRIADTERGRRIREEAGRAGVSVHKTDEVARNPKAMAAAIRADSEVANAAREALSQREQQFRPQQRDPSGLSTPADREIADYLNSAYSSLQVALRKTIHADLTPQQKDNLLERLGNVLDVADLIRTALNGGVDEERIYDFLREQS